jgi:thiamine-monophosphate kinase
MSGGATPLGPGAEFDRLRAVFRRLGPRLRGAGDDAALITVDGARLALSCDLAIEDQHFRLSWLTAEETGWRACAAALSDLAAVAAEPLGVLAAVGVPAGRDGEFLERLMEGIASAAASTGAVLWGGDLVRAQRVTVDVTVVGRADRPVRRSGAQPGDGLWVTGQLGAPRAALAAWEAGRPPAPEARQRFAHPVPRIAEAAWLRDQGATALIDVSDGLVGDAGHLAAASEVGLVIEAERVPVHPAAGAAAAGAASDAGALDAATTAALLGGEEYELLVTLPPGFGTAEGGTFAQRFGLPLTRVGTVAQGDGVRLMRHGRYVSPGRGFSHF